MTSFTTNNYIDINDRMVLDSWAHCQKNGLDVDCVTTPQPGFVEFNERAINPLMSYFRHYVLKDLLVIFYDSIDRYGGALFYAYENKIIFSQRGNKTTLDYFNQLNIGQGSSIDERYIGTTAASFLKTGEEAVLEGDKHYLEILKPFISYCERSGDEFGNAYTMIFIPHDLISEHFMHQINLYRVARNHALTSHQKEIEFVVQNDLFEKLHQQTSQAVLMLDSQGKVISINQHFQNWFNIDTPQKILNNDFLDLFPELRKMLQQTFANKKISQIRISPKNLSLSMPHLYVGMFLTNASTYPGVVVSFSPIKETIYKPQNERYSHGPKPRYSFSNIISNNDKVKKLKELAYESAQNHSTIVIAGESGTGKELFAQSIHNASPRKNGPFISINCAAVPPELIASELFGYAEGAFTGSRKGGSIGKLEAANGGTLFLDEISEMPMAVQIILLRALEERVITPVGSNKETSVDFRLICATNKDLFKMVQDGKFRLDFYYRINVLNLQLPALKDRRSDIPLLIDHYLDHFNREFSKNITSITPEALHAIMNYPWPGNLRELRNTIEYASNYALGQIQIKDLPPYLFSSDSQHNLQIQLTPPLKFEEIEKKEILALMTKYRGNKSEVAKEMGIARSTLYKRLEKYKL